MDECELSVNEATHALSGWFDQRMREINLAVAEGRTLVNATTMKGKVKTILAEKQFGFITDDNGTDRFFHKDQTVANFDALKSGDRVTFVAVENPKKGPRAEQVDIAIP